MKISIYFILVSTLFFLSCSNPNSTDIAGASAQEMDVKIKKLLKNNQCNTCHKVAEKLIGPSYQDIAQRKYSKDRIIELIYNPEPENWEGYPAMLPMRNVPMEDAQKIAEWIISLEKN